MDKKALRKILIQYGQSCYKGFNDPVDVISAIESLEPKMMSEEEITEAIASIMCQFQKGVNCDLKVSINSLEEELDRLHKSIISICTTGTEEKNFRSVPESTVAIMKAELEKLKNEVEKYAVEIEHAEFERDKMRDALQKIIKESAIDGQKRVVKIWTMAKQALEGGEK